MNYIISFFDWITNVIMSIWDFFVNFLESMILLFQYLGVALSNAFNLVTALPSWLLPFGTVTVTVSVLYVVLGRQAGKGG